MVCKNDDGGPRHKITHRNPMVGIRFVKTIMLQSSGCHRITLGGCANILGGCANINSFEKRNSDSKSSRYRSRRMENASYGRFTSLRLFLRRLTQRTQSTQRITKFSGNGTACRFETFFAYFVSFVLASAGTSYNQIRRQPLVGDGRAECAKPNALGGSGSGSHPNRSFFSTVWCS